MRTRRHYLGFLGFIGFSGFSYWQSGEVTDLAQFAFFAFFAYFWIAKISLSIPDERYLEDVKQAKAFVGDLALIEASLLFLLALFFSQYRALLVLAIALSFSSLIIAYAIKLYLLEEK